MIRADGIIPAFALGLIEKKILGKVLKNKFSCTRSYSSELKHIIIKWPSFLVKSYKLKYHGKLLLGDRRQRYN